jgi:SPP1 gp7 family putative phage head morphogenesis protein
MTSKQYWTERVLREANLSKSINTIEKDLKRIYQKSYNRLSDELKKLYWEILETEGKVLPSHLYQYNRYYILMNKIQDELVTLGKKETQYFEKTLTNLYEFNRTLINPNFDVSLNKQAIQTAIHQGWLGDVWSNRIWNNTNALSSKIREHTINIFATGATTDDFIKDLMKDFNVSYNNAKRLVVTELAHYSTMSTIDGYRAEGITKYKVIVEKDCCDKCNELASKVYDINDDSGLVPDNSHCNCRCSIVAVV